MCVEFRAVCVEFIAQRESQPKRAQALKSEMDRMREGERTAVGRHFEHCFVLLPLVGARGGCARGKGENVNSKKSKKIRDNNQKM